MLFVGFLEHIFISYTGIIFHYLDDKLSRIRILNMSQNRKIKIHYVQGDISGFYISF